MSIVLYYTGRISKLFRRITDDERAKLITIIEATSDFVAVCNPDGHMTYFNKAARNMLGFKENDDISTIHCAVTHPEWAGEIVLKEGIPAAVRNGTWTGETAFLSRDGNVTPVLQTIIAHKSPDGSLDYLSAIARDITELKRTEEKLRASEAALSVVNSGMKKLFTAIEQAAEGIIMTGVDGTILYVNPAFTEITGYKAEDALGKTPRILNSGLNPPELFEDLWKTILSGSKWSGTIINKKKRGEIYYEEITISPVMDDAGSITGFIGIKTDITERKRAEERLRSSEATLHTAQALAQIGSWHLDIRTNRLIWSAESHRIFGIPQQDAVDLETFISVLHPDDRDFVLKAWGEAVAGAPYDIEHRIVVNGETRWVRERAKVERDEEGLPISGIGTTQDITERRKLEDELRCSRDKLRALASYLEAAREDERTRIAREVHDELGQELTRLNIDLFGLTSSIKRSKAQEKDLFLEKTDRISEGIDIITEKVHTIAMDLRPGMLDQIGLAAAIEWQAGEFQKKNDIKCYIEVKGVTDVDNAVSTALFRILQEALTNIVRHAKATKVDIRLSREDGFVCLEVADNGRGIRNRDLQSVHSLGLLGMKERALALGGVVDISGRLGAGTTVTIRIPEEK